jgi:hypothetical protein
MCLTKNPADGLQPPLISGVEAVEKPLDENFVRE